MYVAHRKLMIIHGISLHCALHRRNKNIQNQNQLSHSFFIPDAVDLDFMLWSVSGDALAYYNICAADWVDFLFFITWRLSYYYGDHT